MSRERIFEHNSSYILRVFPRSPIHCRCTLTWRWSFLRTAQVHTVQSFLSFFEYAQCCESWEYVSTRIPLALHQFDSDLYESDFPNTIIFCCSKLRQVGHWHLPDRAPSRRTYGFWHSLSQSLLSQSGVVNLDVRSLKAIVVRAPISVRSMINCSVIWNSCFTDFWSWFWVYRRFSKKSRPRWTAAGIVTFMNIRHTALFTSIHLLDFHHKPFVRSSSRSPWEVLIETCEFYVVIFCFHLWNSRIFQNFWTQQVSPSLLSNYCSKIHNQKIPVFPEFHLCRQVSPLLQPSTHQGTHLSAFLENSTLRRILNFWLPSRQVSLWMFWVSKGSSTQSDGSRLRNLSRQLMSSSLLWSLILPQTCLLFVLVSSSLSFSGSLSSWNSERSKKIWAQQRKQKWLMLYKWKRLFHSPRVKLPFVKMSASWCLKQTCLIWILGSRLILSNNQSRATLWVLDKCLTVGFSAFDDHLSHGFSVHKNKKLSTTSRSSHVGRNVINIIQIEIRAWLDLVFHVWSYATGFTGTPDHWICWFGLVRIETLQLTNPKDQARKFRPCVNLHPEN